MLIVSFSTPWTPPVPIIKTLIDKHPKLEFHMDYIESGMGFAGVISNTDEEEYSEDDPEYRDLHNMFNGYDDDWDDEDEGCD